jgi:uncharacterized protein YjbK
LKYEDFLRLTQEFDINQDDFKEQTNYYFDTAEFQLKENQSALRVRMKNNTYTLTLKQQFEKHILETHQTISKEIFEGLTNGCPLPNGEVAQMIQKMDIEVAKINYLGSLTTYRVELPYRQGLLVFDESHYLGITDYEIEYESADYNNGLKNFEELLYSMNIPKRETESKIARFFKEKNKII